MIRYQSTRDPKLACTGINRCYYDNEYIYDSELHPLNCRGLQCRTNTQNTVALIFQNMPNQHKRKLVNYEFCRFEKNETILSYK